jgi:glycosyltransferase involved in cell wall biosynthesis
MAVGAAAPMRVLMTADAVGGVWTYATTLAASLAPYGVEIVLATMGPRPGRAQREQVTASLPNVALVESDYKLEWMADPREDVERAGRWLLDLAAAYRPDIVHLNGYAHGSLDWRAPVLVAGHSCVLSWWEAVKGEPAPAADWATYHAAVARGLRAADAVVAPTRAMLDALHRHYGLPIERGRVIANGIAPSHSPGTPLPTGARESKQPFILSAGRLWDEAKNVAALDRVAADLPWPVRIAGDAAHPDGHVFAASHAALLGRLDAARMAEQYAGASVYALPARYEPFGLSALEAAAAGCALVLGDIRSLRETWGDAALFVPPEDDAALAAALRRLIGDPVLRARYAARAHRRAGCFTAGRMARAYADLYRTLLRSAEPSVPLLAANDA